MHLVPEDSYICYSLEHYKECGYKYNLSEFGQGKKGEEKHRGIGWSTYLSISEQTQTIHTTPWMLQEMIWDYYQVEDNRWHEICGNRFVAKRL